MFATPAIFSVAQPWCTRPLIQASAPRRRREATVMRAEIRDRPPSGQQVGSRERVNGLAGGQGVLAPDRRTV